MSTSVVCADCVGGEVTCKWKRYLSRGEKTTLAPALVCSKKELLGSHNNFKIASKGWLCATAFESPFSLMRNLQKVMSVPRVAILMHSLIASLVDLQFFWSCGRP